jgi:hypothetical protein
VGARPLGLSLGKGGSGEDASSDRVEATSDQTSTILFLFARGTWAEGCVFRFGLAFAASVSLPPSHLCS